MQFLSILCFLAICGGLIAIGARLLWAGLRRRTVLETAYGAGYLLGGAAAFSRGIFIGALGGGEEHRAWLIVGGVLGALGVVAILIGLRRIFRPRSVWALALVAVSSVFVVASVIARWGTPVAEMEFSPAQRLHDVGACLAYLWGVAESWVYHRKLGRRLKLGLSDPVTTEQFRLWAISFLCAAGAIAVNAVATVGMAMRVVDVAGLFVALQLLLVISVAGTWCAFYPPVIYRRWVQTRWQAAQVGAD